MLEYTPRCEGMFAVYPIGFVRKIDERRSAIELIDRFSDGLKGIEDNEHITVLFWMHKLGPEHRRLLQVHPMGDPTKEKKGVFALRSPMRPNPIGVTRVKLIERRGSTLIVEGLDAFDGSPVIDLKSG